MNKRIEWSNKKMSLGELIPWERNPRKIEPEQAERLAESLEEFGQVEVIAIGPNGEIYNGHQRLKILMDVHGGDYEVDVRQSSRELSEREHEKLTVYLHKGATGDWDFDVLLNEFQMSNLLDWGFKAYELGEFTDNGDDADYDGMWQGMPEFEQGEVKAYHTVKVHFMTREDAEEFSELVGQTITDKTKYIWYPKKDPENLKPYKCEDES